MDILTKKYVDAPSQAKTRVNTAENMYNIMIMEESNNNPVIIKDNIIKVLTTEQLSLKEYFTIDLSYYYDTKLIIEKENEFKNRTEFIKNMINNAFKKLNIANIDGGKDEKISDKNISIIITSTKNQKINENEKVITIDLGKCENILKKEYNISQNDSLYILEIISEEEEGMKIPKIEYEVYYSSYNDNNLDKLNLTLCKGTKIEISIPVKINGNIDKYNKSSNYYNDVCYKTTTESGTDISLKDRRNEFVENNMTLCEENCELIDYNYINEKAKCSCEIKTTITPDYDFEFNKKEFFRSFTDVTSISNINIIKCYEIILNIKNLINNYGFCILASIMLLYIITLFIFWFYSYKKLKMNLFYIYIILYRFQQKQFQPTFNGKKKGFKQKNIKARPIKRRNNNNSHNDIFINFNKKNSTINNFIKKNQLNNARQITQNKKYKSNSRLNNIKKLNFLSYDIKISYIKKLLEQKQFEINSLNYENALKIDQRNYFQYYTSLLNNNHPLIFSFCNYDDYNSLIIKIYLFFFSFCSDLTINALFFNDETMHKIYKDKGKFDLIYQIPQILYSTLISRFIDAIIKNLALSQDNFVELKQEKNGIIIKKKYYKTLKTLRVKFIIFYINSFIILSFFGYYITCFCGIYINTQIHLIKDCIISFIISLIYPFVINLVPGIFRIPSLRIKKSSGKYLYNFSTFLENFIA